MQGDCPTPGCTGIGHVKGAKYTGHHRYGLTYHYMAQNGLPSESGIIFKKTEMLSAHQLNSWLFLLILYLFL